MSFRGMEAERVFEIPSDSNPTKSYLITQWSDKQSITCTCPSFVMSPKQRGKDILDRDCKHTDRVRNSVGAAYESPVPHAIPPVETKQPATPAEQFAQALQKKKDDELKELEMLDPRVTALITSMSKSKWQK